VRIGACTVGFLWRDAWLKRSGYEVLRVTDRWMREAPEEVASTIRILLQLRVPSG
jgi:very-short-patch-repair endonuclease